MSDDIRQIIAKRAAQELLVSTTTPAITSTSASAFRP